MRVGVDFDNTIVCYDAAFASAASARGLIPADVGASKGQVRDYLRRVGRENDWTELQGYVYGPGMTAAEPYPGALECLAAWSRAGLEVYIISHKTRFPYLGPQYDLHAAAWDWLERHGVVTALSRDHIHLELTKEGKLARIAGVGCTHFIDDLPEFLAEPTFPHGVERCLFDVHDAYPNERRFRCLHSWPEMSDWLFSQRQKATA